MSRIYNDQYGANKDIMEVTFSIADTTVQIAKVKSVQELVQGLSQFQMGNDRGNWQASDLQWNINVTSDTIHCATRSAADHTRLILYLDEKEKKP